MGRREKFLDQFRNNPNNRRFEDLDKLLRWYGFEGRPPRRGSHHVYKRKGHCTITIPYDKPVNSVYVRKAVALIEAHGDQAET